VAAPVRKVRAEPCGQADKVRRCSGNQQDGCVVLCSDDLVAYREPVGPHTPLPIGAWRIGDRHEDHAEDNAEEQSVEVRDETAHKSSNAGALVREC